MTECAHADGGTVVASAAEGNSNESINQQETCLCIMRTRGRTFNQPLQRQQIAPADFRTGFGAGSQLRLTTPAVPFLAAAVDI